ncbi:MAG: phosphoglycerate kinase [Bacteroidia bacterium]|nr:phosphoglycerate kinase [Bacteroidia bacterium]
MKTVDGINFKDKRALIRVDFNVPLDDNFKVTDGTRLRGALPTIQKILKDGGSVVLMSHLGRPKNGPEEKFSLKHIVSELENLLDNKVQFVSDCIGETALNSSSNLQNGEVLLLENLRFYSEETKGDEEFASQLAKHGNFYVNDAFGTAHRAHASTATVAKFFDQQKAFGYLMAKEINNANKIMKEAEKPFTAIMGGAKVSDKILIIEQLLSKTDNLIIGGGMAFTFAKANGGNIGNSLCEDDKLDLAKRLQKDAENRNVNLCLPVDAIVADKFALDASTDLKRINDIPDGWMGLDIGERSIEEFVRVIKKSKTILWNGPMGVFEMPAFENGTKKIAEAIADATEQGAFTLIGGGDSAAAINKFNLANKVSYVSTGGGALLEYMEGKKLPGIEMIMN